MKQRLSFRVLTGVPSIPPESLFLDALRSTGSRLETIPLSSSSSLHQAREATPNAPTLPTTFETLAAMISIRR